MTPKQELKLSENKTRSAIAYYKSVLEKRFKGSNIYFKRGPDFADYDYEVYIDEELEHYLEIKCRRCSLKAYPQTKIPLRKHTFAEHSLKHNGRTSFLLISFADAIVVLDLSEEPEKVVEMLAREDRGSETDLYAMYPLSLFTKI